MKYQPDISSLKDYSSLGYDGQKPDISLREYAVFKLSPDLLVAITTLFFPEFVVHENGVFFAERFSVPLYNSWYRGHYKGDLAATERMINHVHLGESYRGVFEQLNKQNLYFVGEVLVQTWKAALTYEFPERFFEVRGTPYETGFGPDAGDFIITFWQSRKVSN